MTTPPKKPPKKKSTVIWLDDKDRKALRKLGKIAGLKMGATIRMAIHEVLASRER